MAASSEQQKFVCTRSKMLFPNARLTVVTQSALCRPDLLPLVRFFGGQVAGGG
jgi:hypothetical protein